MAAESNKGLYPMRLVASIKYHFGFSELADNLEAKFGNIHSYRLPDSVIIWTKPLLETVTREFAVPPAAEAISQ